MNSMSGWRAVCVCVCVIKIINELLIIVWRDGEGIRTALFAHVLENYSYSRGMVEGRRIRCELLP